jgi:hypothetical protein
VQATSGAAEKQLVGMVRWWAWFVGGHGSLVGMVHVSKTLIFAFNLVYFAGMGREGGNDLEIRREHVPGWGCWKICCV